MMHIEEYSYAFFCIIFYFDFRCVMKKASVIVLGLLWLVAACQGVKVLDFALEYVGHCEYASDRASCELKASSEEVVTRIKGTGAVETEILRLVGSISHLRFHDQYNPINRTFTATGEVTFGVHTTHEQHKLHFRNMGLSRWNASPHPEEISFGGAWNVTSGEGAFSDAVGTLTANGILDTRNGDARIGLVGIVWHKN
jgi:hypothetical protein